MYAALMKVRQTIIDTILADSDSIQLKRTSGYDVLKEKHNFAEITRGTNRFNVSVMSKSLTPDQINKVKINPASFGWSIDADFTVFDEGDIEMAVQLIRQSRGCDIHGRRHQNRSIAVQYAANARQAPDP